MLVAIELEVSMVMALPESELPPRPVEITCRQDCA